MRIVHLHTARVLTCHRCNIGRFTRCMTKLQQLAIFSVELRKAGCANMPQVHSRYYHILHYQTTAPSNLLSEAPEMSFANMPEDPTTWFHVVKGRSLSKIADRDLRGFSLD